MSIVFIFLFAITIGSFLNVCIYRIPAEKSIISPPSSCGSCGHELSWKDLFPILSYVFLGGKCRYCKAKVSMRYPFVELLTGLLICTLYLKYGLGISFFKYSILTLFMIVIALIDFDTTDVYSVTTIPIIVIGILFVLFESYSSGIGVIDYIKNVGLGLLGGVICAVVIGLICYLTGAMGEGDIEIAVAGGIFIGWKLSIFMILFSFIIGGILGITLIALKKKKRTDYIAFGPSIAISIYLVSLVGLEFISEYIYKF